MSKKKTDLGSHSDRQNDAKVAEDEAPKTDESIDAFAALREAPRRKPREKWRRGLFGLVLVASPLVLMLLPGLIPAAFENDALYDVIRLVILALLAIGCSLTVSAFFDVDVQASFDIPGLKKGTVQAVGSIVFLLMLGGLFHAILPSLKPDPQSEAIVSRGGLLEDILTHKSRGLSIKADVGMFGNADTDIDARYQSLKEAIISGFWSTTYQSSPKPKKMDSLIVKLEEEQIERSFYIEEYQEEPLIMSILTVDPEAFKLSLYLFLSEKRLKARLCGSTENPVASQPTRESYGKEEIIW